jgi:hypothetical protein
MIHVIPDNALTFGRVAGDVMPEVEVLHFVDGGLPSMAEPSLRSSVLRRLRTLASFAEESGAEAVLLTCTAFGRLVADVRPSVGIPVLLVLELMVAEALRHPGAIGVIATHPGTLACAARMIEEEAALQDRCVAVTSRFCPGAFDALRRNDWPTHNRIVLENLRDFVQLVDVVVAPQPSIERALIECGGIREDAIVLTSPRLSALRLKEALDSSG